MAFRDSRSDVEQQFRQTAQHIESAVMHCDDTQYQRAVVDEVNEFRWSRTESETTAYIAGINKQLKADQMLPAVALFDANSNFKKMDADKSDYVNIAELDKYKSNPDLNDLQRGFVGYVQARYDRIRNYNTSWETAFGGNNEAISQDDTAIGSAQQRSLVDLFAKGDDGISLYDRLKDKNGNIDRDKMGSLARLDLEHSPKWMTAADRSTLWVMYDWKLAPFGVGSLKRSEIDQMAKQNGTSLEKLENLPPGLRDKMDR